MSEKSPRKHVYHAEASALSGSLVLPLAHEIKPQSYVKLSEHGGYLSQRSENYRLEGVVSFGSAYTQVAGNLDTKPSHGWNTLATAVIENLNVLDVVTCDRIVAQVSTDHPLAGYVPTVSFLGSRFENLRIAGHPVKLDLDMEIFGPKPKGDAAYTSDDGFMKRVSAQRERIRSHRNLPSDISARYNQLPSSSRNLGKIECSLVNNADGSYPGLSFGHVIDVPNFGKIHLATITLEQENFEPKTGTPKQTLINLTMISMEMGCIGGGTVAGGTGKTNGTSQP